VGPVNYTAKCDSCDKALYLSKEHLIEWQGAPYHLACLLDSMAKTLHPAPLPELEETQPLSSPWGLFPP
jgi:hypothetical protein